MAKEEKPEPDKQREAGIDKPVSKNMEPGNIHETAKKSKEDEYKELLQRLQADFENYKKRAEKENCQVRQYSVASFIRKLLPLLDSFELALKNCSKNDQFVKGIELIYAQFYSILESEGLTQIKAAGQKFDPYLHEVLLKEEGPEDGIVTEELLKGYMLKDMVLRHSKVKISEKPVQKNAEGQQK